LESGSLVERKRLYYNQLWDVLFQLSKKFMKQRKPMKPAKIITFDEFKTIRDSLGRIVCTSGAYDPVHPGHLSCILESKRYGDVLVVLVNGNSFLAKKKGRAFQDIKIRCQIISCIKGVDYVIPFELDDDQSVSRALFHLKPDIFTKGGSKYDHSNTPEYETCQKLDIYFIPQVGLNQEWVGSHFVKEWEEYCLARDKRNKEKETPEIKKLKKKLEEDREFFMTSITMSNCLRESKNIQELKKLEQKMKRRSKASTKRKEKLRKLQEESKSKTIDDPCNK